MSWTLTSHGRAIDLANPMAHASHISVAEIAHSLACINRFTGHALRPYSVAEHSLLVCDIVGTHMGLGVHAQLAALMHDAHECITNDLASPAKPLLGMPWADFEGAWEHAFHTAFALRLAFDTFARQIRQADLIALATERRDVMPPGGPAWASLASVQPVQGIDLRDRDNFTWQDWRDAFVDRYDELDFARNQQHHTPTHD